MGAIEVVVLSVLLVLIAASTVHALQGVQPAFINSSSICHADSIVGDTNITAPAISTASGDEITRPLDLPLPLGHVRGLHPLMPDVWLDEEEDDDDDDESWRRSLASGPSAFSVEEALGLRRPSRTLGGSAVLDGSLPVNLFLAESARRM